MSSDLLTWSNLTSFGTLLSNPTNGPCRFVGDVGDDNRFFRALKTDGLYDPTLLRTISLTFTQSNWQTLLANGRTYGTNVYCSLLTMDNGATNFGVGARYRGNTPYSGLGGGGAPVKKSLNLDINYGDTNADLMGYGTLNLNNAYGDETIMRESLYFNVMRLDHLQHGLGRHTSFVKTRYSFLTNHAELKPLPPNILAVHAPTVMVAQGQMAYVTAEVTPNGANGLDSVWLYYRNKTYGRFTAVQMLDDGAHGDGEGNDGVFGASITNISAGAKVHYYVEARSANSAKAACFAPARAEQETYSYRVALTTATNTPVVINEIMASNKSALADPQGQYADWIELRNLTGQPVELTGHYLSDEEKSPRKWPFPAGTIIPAEGYLLVWADENGTAATGLHANFKLAASGEAVYLIDTDANLNVALDHVAFGAQTENRAYGRTAADADLWTIMDPTPGAENQ